jgi:hypothetical protein
MRKLLLIGIALILVVSSCTIEKRRYSSGYHVQKKYNVKGVEQEVNATSSELICDNCLEEGNIELEFNKTDFIEALAENNSPENDGFEEMGLAESNMSMEQSQSVEASSLEVISNSESIFIKPEKVQADSCDLIMLRDGTEVMGKVVEIGIEEIKYRKCDNLNGPVVVMKKSKVFLIKYPNGTKDVFNEAENERASETDQPSKVKEKNESALPVVLGWLCLLLGIFLLLFVSILGGVLLIVGGIILIIAGMSRQKD